MRHEDNFVELNIDDVRPHPDNVRRYIDYDRLQPLIEIYQSWANGEKVVLPDDPIVRKLDTGEIQLLAGERRTTAAKMAGVDRIRFRLVELGDEDAYRFVLEHNDTEGITVAELAFRCAEMVRMGYSYEEVALQIKGKGVARYKMLGDAIRREWFTDTPKQYHPSISEWMDALKAGPKHFRRCFQKWDSGEWGKEQCRKNFRKYNKTGVSYGDLLGFRVTVSPDKCIVRGQLMPQHLNHSDDAVVMLDDLITVLQEVKNTYELLGHFGTAQKLFIKHEVK